MSEIKQYTIVMYGNRFGDYLSETMDGYYTKWELKFRKRSKYDYGLLDAQVKEVSLSENEISDRLIKRTKEFYDDVHQVGEYPYWLKLIIKEE